MNKIRVISFFVCMTILSACGNNTPGEREELIEKSWSEMHSAYQKRAELVPDLVGVVQNYAADKRDVFVAVIEARANLLTAETDSSADAEKANKFVAKQKELSVKLVKLIALAEKNPVIKADANFKRIHSELATVEGQIVSAQKRYVSAIKDYNESIQAFPANLTAKTLGHEAKKTLAVQDGGATKRAPQLNIVR